MAAQGREWPLHFSFRRQNLLKQLFAISRTCERMYYCELLWTTSCRVALAIARLNCPFEAADTIKASAACLVTGCQTLRGCLSFTGIVICHQVGETKHFSPALFTTGTIAGILAQTLKLLVVSQKLGLLCQQDSFLQFPSSWGSAPSEGGEVFQLFQQRTSVLLMAGDRHDLCVHLALITAFVPTLFSGLGVPLPGEVSASWSSSWKLSDTLRISLILG